MPRPLHLQYASYYTPTAVALKDVHRGDRGEAHRLTYEERKERRTGQARATRDTQEKTAEELQAFISDTFPAELDDIFNAIYAKATREAYKVTHIMRSIESVPLDLAGAPAPIPASRVGQVIKVNESTYEYTAHNAAAATAALNAISRHDSALTVSKDGAVKVKIVVPPMTTQRREKAAQHVHHLMATLKQKLKIRKTGAIKFIGNSTLASSLRSADRTQYLEEIDQIHDSFLKEKEAELELLVEEVLQVEADIDLSKPSSPS